MKHNNLISTSIFIFLLPLISSEDCIVRRDYMNVRHALKIPYNYDAYSDSYVYGTKIQCTSIKLGGNKTVESYIKPDNLEQAKISQLIYIANSDIPTIETGAFDPYNRIRKLLIGRNGIKKIEPFVFNEMQNLTDLQLYDNELSEIGENTFDGCGSLRILNLANNKIKSLKNINIPNLQKLHLENNSISSIKAADFQNLQALKTLNLSSNSISYLDENLFNNLKNFSDFYMSYNRIGYVPPKLFKTSILNLEMSHNQIREINCEKLNGVVDLSYNQLTKICNFVNATYIDLRSNKISYVSSENFRKLNRLRTLDLSQNNILDIHVNAFVDLFNVTYMNLSRNGINKIYIGTFHSLNNLEELDLSYNNLETFQHGVFTGLGNLENLDLSYNKIDNLDVKVFYPLVDLEMLKLRGNFIQIIDPSRFVKHLPDLRMISIDFGEIGCDYLMKMLHIFNEKFIKIEKGSSIKTHNINGIACDPDKHDEPPSEDNSTEVVKPVVIHKEVQNYSMNSIADTMANIHTILVLTSVAVIIFLTVKCIVLIRTNFGYCRRNASLPTCSLKLLSESE